MIDPTEQTTGGVTCLEQTPLIPKLRFKHPRSTPMQQGSKGLLMSSHTTHVLLLHDVVRPLLPALVGGQRCLARCCPAAEQRVQLQQRHQLLHVVVGVQRTDGAVAEAELVALGGHTCRG